MRISLNITKLPIQEMKKISIIIPVYNEKNTIRAILKKIAAIKLAGIKKEIIIVDDGSDDGTKKILKEIEKNKKYKVFYHPKNKGKGAALKTGFLKTTGDIVIIQDADLEYNPQDYPKLLKPFIENQADVVYGSRFLSGEPKKILYYWHSVANKLLTTFSNILTNLNFTDIETGFKVFRGDLIRKIAPTLESQGFGFEPEITAKISKIKNLSIYEVGISYWGRTYQEGKKIRLKDALEAFWLIIKYNLIKK